MSDAYQDGRASMRFVFVSLIQRIAMLPAGPKGHLTDERLAAMSHLEWTAGPWVATLKSYREKLAEVDELVKLAEDRRPTRDTVAYMRYVAVLAGLKEAKMLDIRETPYDAEALPPGMEPPA